MTVAARSKLRKNKYIYFSLHKKPWQSRMAVSPWYVKSVPNPLMIRGPCFRCHPNWPCSSSSPPWPVHGPHRCRCLPPCARREDGWTSSWPWNAPPSSPRLARRWRPGPLMGPCRDPPSAWDLVWNECWDWRENGGTQIQFFIGFPNELRVV